MFLSPSCEMKFIFHNFPKLHKLRMCTFWSKLSNITKEAFGNFPIFVGCIISSFKKVWQSLLDFHPHLVQHCIEAVINSRLKPSKPPPISGLACVALRKPLEDSLLWIPKFSFCLWPSLIYICLCVSVFVFIWHGMCRNAQTP